MVKDKASIRNPNPLSDHKSERLHNSLHFPGCVIRRKGGWEAAAGGGSVRSGCGHSCLGNDSGFMICWLRKVGCTLTPHLVFLYPIKSSMVWVHYSLWFMSAHQATNRTRLLWEQRVHTIHFFSPVSEKSHSTCWSYRLQVEECLCQGVFWHIPSLFLRRGSVSCMGHSEERLELWQKSGNTNHLLSVWLWVRAELIFFPCYLLFLTFRVTPHGPVSIVLDLTNALYRWRHRALVLVVVNVFHWEP